MEKRFFAAMHKEDVVRKKSSSGGAFTAISDSWFKKNGDKAVVYGCAMTNSMQAVHIRAENTETRDMMRGSKYIGSLMSGVMQRVCEDLKSGKYVAFSGTPCQISGLIALVKAMGIRAEERLLTIEVICHGVGSVTFFKEYIAAQEKRFKSKAVACTFRGKSRPGKHQQMRIQFTNGKVYESPSVRYDGFYSAYTGNYILRPSCYRCRYAQQERYADISIADFWGDHEELMDTRSLIVANTPQGMAWIEAAGECLNYEPLRKEMIHQPNMNRPTQKPSDYESFWAVFDAEGYDGVHKYLGNSTFIGKVRYMLACFAYKLYIVELLRKLKKLIR